jgi:D-alanyl-D-alanine carboxypeptidase
MVPMLVRTTVLVVVVLALVGGSRIPIGAAAASGEFPEADRAALTAIIEKGMTEKRLPGLNVGIWIPGRGTLVQPFGTGDLETGAPMAIGDHVRIASITKSFTATAILQLVDEDKLRLDDPLAQFIEGIPNGERITIRHLLNMTSGIYDFPADPQFMADITADPLMAFGPDDVIAILRRNKPNFEPGAEVVYCDTNYILLGVILEQVSGRKAAEIITEDFIAPLKLTGTSFPDTPAMPEPYAHGYYAGEDARGPFEDFTISNPNLPWTAGAMIATLEDLRVWAKVLATGSELSPATQQERLTFKPFTTGNEGASYGLGILNYSGFLGPYGMIFGYTTAIFHLPEADATFVISGNQSTNFSMAATEIFLELARQLYPERFE